MEINKKLKQLNELYNFSINASSLFGIITVFLSIIYCFVETTTNRNLTIFSAVLIAFFCIFTFFILLFLAVLTYREYMEEKNDS